MKKTLVAAAAAFFTMTGVIAFSTDASAIVCARGPYRAGCAGPHGAVGVHRGYGYYPHGGAVVRRPYGYHGGGVVVRRRYY
ncbi:hypothetical protein [Methylocella sp.]|jgi:hypothetical protein|uniref:hypothetical protein n=1 Tax=Methylocella sp. TaxID=1978226 RepID=UPI003C22F5FF